METTLIILKPDAVQRGLMGEIISRFERKGLQIVGCKLMTISQDLAARHYEAHKDKPFYAGLVQFMTSSPVLVMAVRGMGAIAVSRKMMGATFGSNAEPGPKVIRVRSFPVRVAVYRDHVRGGGRRSAQVKMSCSPAR